jgi:hypothetical protein
MSYIKPVFKSTFDKGIFKTATCLLTISVGQEVHEGDKFATTVDLVNESFGSCIMLIDDSLQRHSMALDQQENADFFYEASILEGNKWLERNECHYKKLSILDNIIRWDKWLEHPHYLEQQQKIKSLIDENSDYKACFDSTIDGFLSRYFPRLVGKETFDMARGQKLCLDYLIEECTALCLWTELNCHFEVYPNKRNQVMDETHQRFVLPSYPDLLHAVAIKFKNRKQLKPQQFQSEQLQSA